MLPEQSGDSSPRTRHVFPTTRWSVVVDAQSDDVDALAVFCRSYWYPLYSYARMTGTSPADAEDLTQSFFERLLSRNTLRAARRERGKLRSFLLRSFKNFAADEWRKRGAQKHGGHQSVLQIESVYAEKLFFVDQEKSVSPDVQYERAWARELLQNAFDRLRATYELAGNSRIFDALQDHLTEGSSALSYKEIAGSLGMTEASVRFAAFKLRQRYRATLKEIVAETVLTEEEVAEELAHLGLLFQSP